MVLWEKRNPGNWSNFSESGARSPGHAKTKRVLYTTDIGYCILEPPREGTATGVSSYSRLECGVRLVSALASRYLAGKTFHKQNNSLIL